MARAAFEQQQVAPRQYALDPIGFIDRFVPANEKGQPWRLSAYQRAVLTLAFVFDGSGRLAMRLLLWSEPKKSGKTFIAALIVIWWASTRANTEVIIVANDMEQAQGRVFRTVVQLCKANGLERSKLVRLRATEIDFVSGTLVTAIACDYRGAAGSRHSLVVFDELWGYQSEALSRLYEELTPPPTEPDAFLLVVTYAGFVNESKLLEAMYQRGIGGARIHPELPVYRDGEMVCFWSHEGRQVWQTPAYYAEQRRSLRPATFARIHENRWVSSESKFITAETYDANVIANLSPVLVDRDLEVVVAADLALKHDNEVVVVIAWQGTKLRLVAHRIWKPTPGVSLDLEQTVEKYIRELCDRFHVREVVIDPWQAARSIATLKADGIPIRELPQTQSTLTAMAQALWEALDGRNLLLYPADDLREHVLNAVAVETPRGLKLAKQTASKKVDAAVALAMACVAAMDAGPDASMPLLYSSDPGSAYQEWKARGMSGTEPAPDEPDEPEVIEATEEEMAARPDAAQWVREPDVAPRIERRRRHADDLINIAQTQGAWFPEDQ